MKEKFINWEPSIVSQEIIEHVNSILQDYSDQGYKLTLRQLYYQLVAKDLLPEKWADKLTGSTNNVDSYKKLGGIVSNGRLSGLIDWNMIEDRSTLEKSIRDIESRRTLFLYGSLEKSEKFCYCDV